MSSENERGIVDIPLGDAIDVVQRPILSQPDDQQPNSRSALITTSAAAAAIERRKASIVDTSNLSPTGVKRYVRHLLVFRSVKIAQFLCVCYILLLTFTNAPFGLRDPATGWIIDTRSPANTARGVIMVNGAARAVVAQSHLQMFCLGVSRMSAFSMYPVFVCVFLTKCRALVNYLSGTPVSMFMIRDQHELHVYAGRYIAVDSLVHTLFHLLRWGFQGNLSLCFRTLTGLSGALAVVFTLFVAFPMMGSLRRALSYEVRKGMHYFFYLFVAGLCYHVPVSAFPNGGFIAPVLGILLCVYTLDVLYVNLVMTEKIETTIFHVLPNGVKLSMDVSRAFQNRMCKGGICYVCLPWIDKTEWHAFSLFEHPTIANRREVFMLNVGDWTEAVHRALQRDTVRPVWVQGPFESPYNNAVLYDNQILVASGIGITPALSVIRNHKESRQINLIWAVRDAGMLEFFLDHLYLDHSGWNLIFYTGKKPLNPAIEESSTNIRVIKGRPDLKVVIPNIIYGIESGMGRPQHFVAKELNRVKKKLSKRVKELDYTDMTARDKLKDLVKIANEEGFIFTELMTEEDEEIIREALEEEKRDLIKETSRTLAKQHQQQQQQKQHDKKNDDENALDQIEEEEALLPPPDDANVITATNVPIQSGIHIPFPQQNSSSLGLHKRHKPQMIQSQSAALVSKTSQRILFQVDDNNDTTTIPTRPSSSSSHPFSTNRRGSLLDKMRGPQSRDIRISSTFLPWVEKEGAVEYVLSLDRETVISTWGMLYCGGSKPVQKTLKQISRAYHLELSTESFAW